MDVTIAVLTYDAEPWLSRQLTACLDQVTDLAVEVLVLDSGSSDRTVAIARGGGPRVRVHEIANRDFGHGRTRNLAASLTEAPVVVFLTQDAVPASTGWLELLLAPLEGHPEVAATFGAQHAPAACRPAVKRTLQETFSALSPDSTVRVRQPGCVRPFFSNVNAAYRRRVLLEQVPFREVDYAEDMAFAADAAAAGLATAYVPAAAVWHAHDYPLRRHYARARADALGSLRTGTPGPDTGLRTTLRNAVSLARRDVRFSFRDPEYAGLVRVRHVLSAPAHAVATSFALRSAGRSHWPA